MGRPAPANPYPLDFDLDQRVKWMNDHGVQMHVLTLSGGMPWQWATPEQGVRLAQIVNDAAIEAHTAHPDRFVAGIAMPVRDPAMALQELNRVAGKPGMRAVALPNSMEQRDYLFEPAFEPIFARCQELGYPLLFHPLDGEANFYSTRLVGPPSVTNWLGFTFEHATTALKFITTGTLDKFPRLEIVLPHGGGAFLSHGIGSVEGGSSVQGISPSIPLRLSQLRSRCVALSHWRGRVGPHRRRNRSLRRERCRISELVRRTVETTSHRSRSHLERECEAASASVTRYSSQRATGRAAMLATVMAMPAA
jgi:hypothetical protein